MSEMADMRPVIKEGTVERIEDWLHKIYGGKVILIKGLSPKSYARLAHGMTVDEVINDLLDYDNSQPKGSGE